MNLASRLIALLIVLTTLQVSGQDRIDFKDGTTFKGRIRGISHSGGVIEMGEGFSFRREFRSSVSKVNWSGFEFDSQTPLKKISCTEFPFTRLVNNKKIGHATEYRFSQRFDASIRTEIIQTALKKHFYYPNDQSLYHREDSLNQITFIAELNSNSIFSPPITIRCELRFGFDKVDITTVLIDVFRPAHRPETLLTSGYFKNGKAKYFGVCMNANKWISEFENRLKIALQKSENSYIDLQNEINQERLRQERAKQAVEDFRNYLSTARIHPLEGIWSVDVKVEGNGAPNFTSQALQIGIKRYLNHFESFPLSSTAPAYDRPYKQFHPTSESNIFLVKTDAPNVKATAYQKSDGVVDFFMELPKEEVQTIASKVGSSYDGDLKLNYRLIKVFPMPDNETATGDEEKTQNKIGFGSGFALNTDGLVATAYHVIEDVNAIYIRGVNGKKNQKLKGAVVAMDKDKDLAILKITDKNFTQIEELPYSLSLTDEKMGAEIFSLGYPKPWAFSEELKYTKGNVSSTKDHLGNETNYQMTVPITGGNSGGPIFNNAHKVIGVSIGGLPKLELLNATFSVKSKYLVDLLKTVTDYAPVSKEPSATSLEDQIEAYKNFVYLIEVSSD